MSRRSECGDDPWHSFPLRDVGSQFKVVQGGRDGNPMEQISYAQLMREAYPGAI